MPKLPLLLLCAVVVACQPTAAPSAAPPSSAPSMATTNGFPTGTYTTTIVAGDIPSAASAEERAGLAGPWEVAFGGNGHALVTYNGQQVVDATYSLSGRDLTLGEDTGEYACHSPARYTWHAAGGELHLTPVADTCVGRQTVLSAHPLVRR